MPTEPLPVKKQDSLGILAGGMAHDFNNILMAILGNADLALDEIATQSPAHSLVSEIHAATLRAADLCRKMLVYSGRGNFEFEVFDLNDLADGLARLLDPVVPGRITLSKKLTSETIPIRADVSQIQQILVNLVTNSVEAIGEEEGAITIETGLMDCGEQFLQQSRLSTELSAGPYVFMQVSDTGPGIKTEPMKQVFEPFFTTKFAGRGLGLSVVQGIVHGHRGAIILDSELRHGAMLTVLFPLAKPVVKPSHATNNESDPSKSWRPKGLVLLADDDPEVRRVASRMLEKIGFTVMLAEDGLQAVEVFQDNSDIIDIVVLDLTMPRLGGREALVQIREMAPGIPVLLSSGYSGEETTPQFPGFEPSGFVQKPYTMARFREALQQVAESS